MCPIDWDTETAGTKQLGTSEHVSDSHDVCNYNVSSVCVSTEKICDT